MVITGGRAALSGPDREAPTPVTIKTNNKYLGAVTVDGGVQEVVVTGGTVGDVLAEAGITLGPDES